MERHHAVDLLRRAGFRATEGRVRLLQALSARRAPATVRELARAVRARLDEANVYRALEALRRRGIVRAIQLERSRVHFELSGEHHHHLVCSTCGYVEDVHLSSDAVLDRQALERSSFACVESHVLEFFGLCAPCARAC